MTEAAAWEIDKLARAEGIVKSDGDPNRSAMIRLLLAFAVRNWRKGWRP